MSNSQPQNVCDKVTTTKEQQDCTLCIDNTSIIDIVCSREQGPLPGMSQETSHARNASLEQAKAERPNDPEFVHYRTAAFLLAQKGILGESVTFYTSAIDIFEDFLKKLGGGRDAVLTEEEVKAAAEAHPEVAVAVKNYLDFLPFCLNEVGILLTRHGRVCDAVQYFDRAIQYLCHVIQFGDINGQFRRRNNCLLVETKKHMACALKSAGEYTFACQLFEQLIPIYRSCPFYGSKLLLSDCTYHVAEMLNANGRFIESEPFIRECVAVRRELFQEIESTEADASDNLSSVELDSTCSQETGLCPIGKSRNNTERTIKPISTAQLEAKSGRKINSFATEVSIALCLLAATIASPDIRKHDEAEAALQEALELTTRCRGICENDVCIESPDQMKEKSQETDAILVLLNSIQNSRNEYSHLSNSNSNGENNMVDDMDLLDMDADDMEDHCLVDIDAQL